MIWYMNKKIFRLLNTDTKKKFQNPIIKFQKIKKTQINGKNI